MTAVMLRLFVEEQPHGWQVMLASLLVGTIPSSLVLRLALLGHLRSSSDHGYDRFISDCECTETCINRLVRENVRFLQIPESE